jgi:hypothetical protein
LSNTDRDRLNAIEPLEAQEIVLKAYLRTYPWLKQPDQHKERRSIIEMVERQEKSLRDYLAEAFNKIVEVPWCIHDPEAFKYVPLRPETTQLFNQNPKGPELARLNRMLFEDAFPDELSKISVA